MITTSTARALHTATCEQVAERRWDEAEERAPHVQPPQAAITCGAPQAELVQVAVSSGAAAVTSPSCSSGRFSRADAMAVAPSGEPPSEDRCALNTRLQHNRAVRGVPHTANAAAIVADRHTVICMDGDAHKIGVFGECLVNAIIDDLINFIFTY